MKLEYKNKTIIITPEMDEFPFLKKWLKKWGNQDEIPFAAFMILLKGRAKIQKSRLKNIEKADMGKSKVIKVDADGLEFDNGIRLYSNHKTDCCENHYLSFGDLTLDDFDGLSFDLSADQFFERIEGYGIALKPIHGHPVRVPGYGSNNGYYSSQLDLVLNTGKGFRKEFIKVFDISECQEISG